MGIIVLYHLFQYAITLTIVRMPMVDNRTLGAISAEIIHGMNRHTPFCVVSFDRAFCSVYAQKNSCDLNVRMRFY